MYFVRRFRDRRAGHFISEQKIFYEQDRTPDAIRAWQLKQFNQQWQSTSRNVPFFRRLARERNLPSSFSSWEQVREIVPISDRKAVQQHGPELVDESCPPDLWRTTGGS